MTDSATAVPCSAIDFSQSVRILEYVPQYPCMTPDADHSCGQLGP